MKNFIQPEKISRFVLEARITPKALVKQEFKNRASHRVINSKGIFNYLNEVKYRKCFSSKQAKRRAQALIGVSLSLSGCMGVYEGGFECPAGKGVGCKSISEVNAIVDQAAVIGNQLSVIRTSSENSLQESASFREKGTACKNSSGSCSASSEIWYAPTFEINQKEKIDSQKKCTTKVLDNANSI